MRLARNGDVEGIRAYVRATVWQAFSGLDPDHRTDRHALPLQKAEALCEAKARHPLVQPRPIDARRAQKVNWSDPAMRAKLAMRMPGRRRSREGRADPSRKSWLGAVSEEAALGCCNHWSSQESLIAGHRRPSALGAPPGAGQPRTASVTGCAAAFRGRRKATASCAPRSGVGNPRWRDEEARPRVPDRSPRQHGGAKLLPPSVFRCRR